MRITYQKQWLAYLSVFICATSMLLPAHGNTSIKFVQGAALLIAGILGFIYLYYNTRKQTGVRFNWLVIVILFIVFISIAIPSYRNETLKVVKNIAWAISFILLLILLYINRHNRTFMKRSILTGLICAAIGILVYYIKTKG